MVRFIAILAMLPSILFGYTTTTENGVTVYLTDGSRNDVQSAITAASDGEIVDIPSGSHEWASQVTVTGKGITIRGQGGGAILGFAHGGEEFTMGEKTFTMQQPDPLVFIREPVVGETLQFHYPVPAADNSLHGEVTAWDPETRVITADITTVNGAGGKEDGTDTGDEFFWIIFRAPLTEIVLASTPEVLRAILITEDDTHNVKVDHLAFRTLQASNTEGGSARYLEVLDGGESYQPVVVSNCTFNRSLRGACIEWKVNRGLLYDNTWYCDFTRTKGDSTYQGISVLDSNDAEWTTPSRLGALDTTGLSKVYIEDCIMHGFRDTFIDLESNGRVCIRNSILHTSRPGGHGMDTGSGNGMREFEYYNNAHMYRSLGTGRDYNMNSVVGSRGGTGVIHSSYVQSILSGFSSGIFYQAVVQQLTRSGGEIPGVWSYGDGEWVYPSVDYPIPQGTGVGYIDGSGGTIAGTTGTRQIGEPVPVWIWNISGTPDPISTNYYGRFSGGAYNTISDSEWSDSGGDLLLTETGASTWLPTATDARVYFSSNGNTLPTGLADGVAYYAIEVSAPSKTWKFSATQGGSAIAYTDSGSGTTLLSAADALSAHLVFDTNGDTVVEGDVVFHTTDVPLPGYEEYPYPHWLQQVTQAGASYSGRLRFDGTGAKPVRTDGVGQPIIFDQ